MELIHFLRVQLRAIGLSFRELPFVMVNPDCIVSETCETFGQSVRLLMVNVVSGETEVHSVESLWLSRLVRETERAIGIGPQPAMLAGRSILQRQVRKIENRSRLDIQLQLQRNPFLTRDDRDGCIVLDAHTVRRRQLKSQLHFRSFAKRLLGSGRAENADHERRSPLPIILNQDGSRLRKPHRQRFSFRQIQFQRFDRSRKETGLAQFEWERTRLVVGLPFSARQRGNREVEGHMQ